MGTPCYLWRVQKWILYILRLKAIFMVILCKTEPSTVVSLLVTDGQWCVLKTHTVRDKYMPYNGLYTQYCSGPPFRRNYVLQMFDIYAQIHVTPHLPNLLGMLQMPATVIHHQSGRHPYGVQAAPLHGCRCDHFLMKSSGFFVFPNVNTEIGVAVELNERFL